MAKKGEISHFETQKKNKPTPQSLFDQFSDKETREVGVKFLEYLSELRTNPSWYATNSYSVNYKGKRVCLLRIDPNYRGGDDRFLIHLYAPDRQKTETYLANLSVVELQPYLSGLKRCVHCAGCAPGVTVTLGSVQMDEMCRYFGFSYHNPTTIQLEAVKKLIEIRREDIGSNA